MHDPGTSRLDVVPDLEQSHVQVSRALLVSIRVLNTELNQQIVNIIRLFQAGEQNTERAM